jgi:hypothetical protein
MFLLVYVDDIIVASSSTKATNALVHELHKEFALKDLGNLHHFLGIEATRSDQGLLLTQGRYVAKLLRRACMNNSKPVSTPLTPSDKLLANDGVPLGPEDCTRYRSIVGGIQYLTITRPDLSFSVNKACQFLHSLTKVHWGRSKEFYGMLKVH